MGKDNFIYLFSVCVCVCVCVPEAEIELYSVAQSCLDSTMPWTATPPGFFVHGLFQAKLHWSWLPFPTSGDLPNPGMEPSLVGRFFTTAPSGHPEVELVILVVHHSHTSVSGHSDLLSLFHSNFLFFSLLLIINNHCTRLDVFICTYSFVLCIFKLYKWHHAVNQCDLEY